MPPIPNANTLRPVQIRANVIEHALFTGNVTISDQHDAARDSFLSRQTHRLFDRGEQFSSAAAALLFQ